MRTRNVRIPILVVAIVLAGLSIAQEAQHRETPLSDARITIQNRAQADGFVRLLMRPVGGPAFETTVDVLARMSENDIAADIEKAMTLVVDDRYEVSRGGGENVRIRKADRDTSPDFTLEITFNTPGLTVTIEN